MTTHIPRSSACIGSVALLGVSFVMSSCGDPAKELHELEGVRVPVAQFFTEGTAADVAPSSKKAGCETWVDKKVYCQQYPVYTGVDARKFKIRFVTISPEGETATLALGDLKRFSVRLGSQNVQVNDLSTVVEGEELKSWGFAKDAANSRVLGTKGIRVEETVFDFTVPGLGALIETKNPSPVLSLDYSAKSSKGGRLEEGFVTFFVYPDPDDAAAWKILTDLAARQGIADDAALARLKAAAKRNTPPNITGVAPEVGASTGKKLDLEATLRGTDPDPEAKLRLQWFTTRGKLGNQRARKTSWDTEGPGAAGAFVVVRDLQGGQDYGFTSVVVKE